jgi:uncharacterized protein
MDQFGIEQILAKIRSTDALTHVKEFIKVYPGTQSLKSLKIAVIGSGISGLSAAWLLSQRHDVHLFEADSRFGGHSNTIDVNEDERKVAIDTGFIVFNAATYPNLVALLDYLDIATTETEMGFSVSMSAGAYEYKGKHLKAFGNLRTALNPRHWQTLAGILTFFRCAASDADQVPETLTLGDYLQNNGYSRAFIERHLLPMAAAVWSSEPSQMLAYPAKAFLRFFQNHALLQFRNRPKWRTVQGGSRTYVDALLAESPLKAVHSQQVRRVERLGGHVLVDGEFFDHAVIGAHADQALSILAAPTPREAEILSTFSYSRNRVVLHRDATLMPKSRRLWSSWNYVADDDVSGASVTYWMNSLQSLPTARDYFVSLNPHRAPAPHTVLREFSYEHPIYSTEAMRQQKRVWSLQGENNTWFCGAYFGAGFHEDGLQAGLAVAEQLGGVMRPWTVANQSGRIHIGAGNMDGETKVLQAAE